MSFFAIITLLFLTSCTKEEILQPHNETDAAVLVAAETIQRTAPTTSSTASADGSSEIPVTKVTSSVGEGLLVVDFSASHNFIDADLEATQTLDFTDANNNVITLTFQVNGYNGGDGTIQVAYAIGGNDLSGLELGDAQIIIEDGDVN